MLVLSVVGNRPQFIKSAPLSLALREAGIEEVVLHTGQHYDPELSQVFFDELRLGETLRGEGVGGAIQVVGDVMRDALDLFLPFATRKPPPYEGPYALLTIHREANTEPERLRRLVAEVNNTGWTFVFPVHPRTRRVL